MTDIPHFDYPPRLVNGHLAVNEQDTLDDITACVTAVLLTHPGQRADRPDFGSPDLTFAQRPVGPDGLVDAVAEWEPRAHLLAEERPDALDACLERINVTVSPT